MGYVAVYDYLCYFKIMSSNKRKIETFEELEDFLHKSNIIFPSKWKAKFNLKKRRPRTQTIWKNYRIYLYGKYRIVECIGILRTYIKKYIDEFDKLYEKYRKKPNKELLKIINEKIYLMLHTSYAFETGLGINKGRKSTYNVNLSDENFLKSLYNEVEDMPKEQRNASYKAFLKMKNTEKKTLTNLGKNTKLLKNIKFPNKKGTVKKILDTDNYWKQRESLLNKSSEEKNNKSIFRKEVEEFNKCIMKIKEPQYNLDYFQTICVVIFGQNGHSLSLFLNSEFTLQNHIY